jgi:hypothetical protein
MWYDHHALAALTEDIIMHDRLNLMQRDDNGINDNFNMQSSFQLKLSETIKQNKTFRVVVRLYEPDMFASKLSFRGNTAALNSLRSQQAPAGTTMNSVSPDPAPNKLVVNEVMELKQFNTKDMQCLTRVTDVQSWNNVLHSRCLVCGVYTVSW